MLRLIDANLNRMGEGLRVLEDIARFYLGDAEISRQLKTLRHELLEGNCSLQTMAARRVGEDVGVSIKLPGEFERADLNKIVIANSRRVQESLRVLEEFAKLSDYTLDIEPVKFENARFTVYKLEKDLLFKLLRLDKTRRLKGLYLILDTRAFRGRDEVEVANQAIRGGVKVIQLRDKQHTKIELLTIAHKLREICEEKEVLFIINDYIDIAVSCRADGIHLGQQDMPLTEARYMLSPDKIIGCSTSNLPEALRAESEGADYIAVGSIYHTSSKEGCRLTGLDIVRQIRAKTSLPLIAIGGITETNIAEVVGAGAIGVAVISAVLEAGDIEKATRNLLTKIEGVRTDNEEAN